MNKKCKHPKRLVKRGGNMTTNLSAFKTKEISASSRVSFPITKKGVTTHYTFEASETRSVDWEKLPNNLEEAEKCIEDEWDALYESVNAKVDKQVNEIFALANQQ